ncbi:hypothetical protein JXI42_12685 [bacterium]|nr:hypothetical protein [bacterium]
MNKLTKFLLQIFTNNQEAHLDKGWVIANHILVSFHVAFISSVLSISSSIECRSEVLQFMFTSYETLISLAFLYITFHTGIAIHEMGHYLKAVRLSALNETLLPEAQAKMEQGTFKKLVWYIGMFLKIPYGAFEGVTKTGLDYHPDAPYNLAVSAAGPRASRNLAILALPVAIILLIIGLVVGFAMPVYIGRLFLGIGLVSLLDFHLADPGKYKEFKAREKAAVDAAKTACEIVAKKKQTWSGTVKNVKEIMTYARIQKEKMPDGSQKWVPWQFRNCGMGGRHTEKEFPESNINLQESMFIPLSVESYEDAQEMTVNLQTRLKEIIENAEGCTVKGIGTEGGIAAYIKKEKGDILPAQRLWRMQKQAILDCGYVPGKDVAMALDPAATELENAYREEKALSGSETVGMYLAWRDKDKTVLSRDELLQIYKNAIEEEDLPIISIEDGFAEDDDEGWRILMRELGEKIHVVGDDNITTKDSSIEEKAEKGLINAALIKLNQIGSVTEGILAMLTAMGKGIHTIVSHRSKSPIEDFEAQVALAANSLGLKAGGGSNSERLFKYEAVVKVIGETVKNDFRAKEKAEITSGQIDEATNEFMNKLTITGIVAREASTNAGIPTVGVDIEVGIPGNEKYKKMLTFEGATPLGTSAGTDEAIHLIDSIIPADSPLAQKFPEFFKLQNDDHTYRFKKDVTTRKINGKNDAELTRAWHRAKRYNGKGCLNAVDNVKETIARKFLGKKITELGDLVELDNTLLLMERDLAIERGTLQTDSDTSEQINVMQRKMNLGMNAILSVSLAMARLKGALEGKQLCDIVRDQMASTMAKTIAANGGLTLIETLKEKMLEFRKKTLKYDRLAASEFKKPLVDPGFEAEVTADEEKSITEEVNQIIKSIDTAVACDDRELWKILMDEFDFEDLIMGLQIVNDRIGNVPLYELLRKQLSVYKN